MHAADTPDMPAAVNLAEGLGEAGKSQGTFVWHAHPDTDDFFLVLQGQLTIQLRGGDIHLGAGELYVVPRGVEHRTFAEQEVHRRLIEPHGTPNTGDPATAAAKHPL